MEIGYCGIDGVIKPAKRVISHWNLQAEEYVPATREELGAKKQQYLADSRPNLPCLKDGDYFLTESGVIAAYLCIKDVREDLLNRTTSNSQAS